MPAQTLPEFVQSTADRARDHGLFEVESDHLLQVNLDGMVWIKAGGMVAYRPDAGNQISFERESMADQGIGTLLKKTFSGEGARLTKARGKGQLYLADAGKRVTLLKLEGDSIFVNGNDLLAFQDGIVSEITMMRKISAIASGGLFNVKLSGRGVVAITTHYHPLTLMVKPGAPVFTDPQATVAWSGSLTPEFKTDIQLKTLLGRGSGESFQMKFEGDGFVVVQPYEETSMRTG